LPCFGFPLAWLFAARFIILFCSGIIAVDLPTELLGAREFEILLGGRKAKEELLTDKGIGRLRR